MKSRRVHQWLALPGVYFAVRLRQKRVANLWFRMVGPSVAFLYRIGL